MENESLPILLITANVGSVFEDPSNLLHLWIKEFLDHIAAQQPAFIALHLQEVGGKTYEKSMEYVQEFIKQLCESDELRDYNRIRVYLDEDYNSAEHFTALGNLYFVRRTVSHVLMWNFLTHEWDAVEGKSIHTGSIETVATKEKAKFPQQFFPECKWSRKGFLRTRWFLNGTVFDLVNIHLFHDASNLEACEEYPSVYCKSRRRALVHTLERFHKDTVNRPVPYFVFGDFNFRCDTEGVIKKLTEDLTMHRVQNTKNDSTKVQYRDATGTNVLTVGKKEFFHCDQSTFKENWLRQFDRELESLRSILYEFPITFPPSYPYEEDPFQPGSYMATRCPAWCDRILVSPAARKLICEEGAPNDGPAGDTTDPSAVSYGIIGANVCMGDHKPVYLSIKIKTSQANGQLALGPDGKVGELTAQEFLDRLQEYTDLNTRIHDQQQEQLDTSNLTILHSQYVKITPIEPEGPTNVGGGGGGDATEQGASGNPEDATVYHGEASGSCCALIFRETTV